MPFRYRLQKILDFRIRKKEEQLQEVRKAQAVVLKIEALIERNNKEIAEILSFPEKDVRACKRETIYRLKSRLGGLFFWVQIMRIVREECVKSS